MSTQEVEALADVPPRDELLARLAGGFQGPLVKAAGLFQAFTRNFAYGLKAYVDQRVEGGEALAADAEPETAEAATEPAEAAAPAAPSGDASEESRDAPAASAAPPAGESDSSEPAEATEQAEPAAEAPESE